jgi:RHS repeat-associated protein
MLRYPVGNRLSSLIGQYSVNSGNELTAAAANSYTYDSNGNMLTKTSGTNTTTYAWDFENRLSSVTLPNNGGTVSFRYDPFGRRIQKTLANNAAKNYLYDGSNIIAELNASGSVIASYTQGAGIDEPLAMRRGGYIGYYHADGLGSITSLTNPNAQTIATYTYDSFGNTTATEGIFNPYRYTGREQDPETGLYYYRARYYDPSIGRFLSEDPVRFWGGIDFYKYVDNSPTNATDPSGKFVYYGNWCGPDWTGGRLEEYNPSHDHNIWGVNVMGQTYQTPYYSNPIDRLDAACQTHDICYYNCRANNPCDKATRMACMDVCNHQLAANARNSGVSNRKATLLETFMDNMPTFVLSTMASSNSSCGCK